MSNTEMMRMQSEMVGQTAAYMFLAWTFIFFGLQISRIKKSKELGDLEKAKRLKRQIFWLYPLGLVVVFLLTSLFYDIFVF